MLTKGEQPRLVAALTTSGLALYFWDKVIAVAIVLTVVSVGITVYDAVKTKWI